jgi:ABC-type sulfate transport system permease subunit
MRILLSLLSLLVPGSERPRWREEWRAELQHGRWTMLFGAVADAWTMRRLAAADLVKGSRPGSFHAFPQDIRYAARGLAAARGFTFAVAASLAVGIAATSSAFAFLHALTFRTIPGVTGESAWRA